MRKIIIVPAFNESTNLLKVVEEIKQNTPSFDYIIINDCSKDNTMKLCTEYRLNVVNLPINLGIGGAVQTGYKYALLNNYDIAIQMDGDGQHCAEYLESLIDPIIQGKADFVVGSRFLYKSGFQSTLLRRFGIRYFALLINILTGSNISDPTSGYRAASRSVIEAFANYYPRDYPEPESIVILKRNGYKISEVPVEMRERVSGTSSIRKLKAAYYMIKVTVAIVIGMFKTDLKES